MSPAHAAQIAEHTTERAKQRAKMEAEGAGANTLYGFDVRSARLLRELKQELLKEEKA